MWTHYDGDIDNDAVGTSQYIWMSMGMVTAPRASHLCSCRDPNTGLPVAPAGYSLYDDDCDGDASRSQAKPNSVQTPSMRTVCNTIGATDVQQYCGL